jgi:hypothetical protein
VPRLTGRQPPPALAESGKNYSWGEVNKETQLKVKACETFTNSYYEVNSWRKSLPSIVKHYLRRITDINFE